MKFELPLKEDFESTIQGKKTSLFYIKNNKLQAALTNYGARMVSLLVPDKNGKLTDINVGFDNIDKYIGAQDQCYGAIVGRYAGRIANGKFSLDGNQYQLDTNNGSNALHGGITGFQTRVWDVEQASDSVVQFNYVSQDCEEGYPGKITVKVTYTLTNEDELKIDFEYFSDQKTIANIINHNFWNLNGEGAGLVKDHLLQINAQKFNAIDEDCIPVELINVANTPFDFRDSNSIGKRIDEENEQLKNGNGYDHTYALEKGLTETAELSATVLGDISGIKMEVYTTEPGVHFYTGNFMQEQHIFKCGVRDVARTAFCLETQHYPDSPNNPHAPSTVKNAREIYTSTTIYKFLH